MSEINNGGSAFPQIDTDAEEYEHSGNPWGRTYSYGGMSLRDYFAAKALQALVTKTEHQAAYVDDADAMEDIRARWAELSSSAYHYADAMLKARESK